MEWNSKFSTLGIKEGESYDICGMLEDDEIDGTQKFKYYKTI